MPFANLECLLNICTKTKIEQKYYKYKQKIKETKKNIIKIDLKSGRDLISDWEPFKI